MASITYYTGDYGLVEKVQNCFEDCLTNVPLIVKPAARFACKPRVTPALAELNDLCATVSEMTGVDLGYVQYGTSLMGVLAGDDAGKDAVFSEGGRGYGDRPSMELGHDDPHEQVNRIDDPAYAEKVAEMRERMLAWYQETADWVPNRKDMR